MIAETAGARGGKKAAIGEVSVPGGQNHTGSCRFLNISGKTSGSDSLKAHDPVMAPAVKPVENETAFKELKVELLSAMSGSHFTIFGYARSKMTDAELRTMVSKMLAELTGGEVCFILVLELGITRAMSEEELLTQPTRMIILLVAIVQIH
ncbi:hypothetical protein ACLB2K_057078 [Fragaria x ananassa]